MIKLQNLDSVVESQRSFFQTGKTKDIDFRLQQLRKLQDALKKNEQQIYQTLRQDLGKPPMESYTGELGVLIIELRHALKNLRSWVQPRSVSTPLAVFPSKSVIYREPRGVILIIGPWNYPIQLLLSPLIGAISAGNCAILKPSELVPESSRLVAQLIEQTFPPEFVTVVEGGREAGEALLNLKFDHIFFTGGANVGRIVAEAAAKHLTPVTLELGGKSPCIVVSDAPINTTARRIVWGKYFNAGQTCISPDYLLVQKSVKRELLEKMIHCLRESFGPDPMQSPDFARIVNDSHFCRLERLLKSGNIVAGGKTDRETRYIEPTIIDNVSLEDEVMAEEIFGPILPVLEYESIEEAIEIVRQRPDPLSFYLFTKSEEVQKRFLKDIPFGGGCINNTLVHFPNPELPFGGTGASGIGNYHGEYSFHTFSHSKSVVKTPFWIDIKLRYQPYLNKLNLIKRIMR